jgi:hypothetical protein
MGSRSRNQKNTKKKKKKKGTRGSEGPHYESLWVIMSLHTCGLSHSSKPQPRRREVNLRPRVRKRAAGSNARASRQEVNANVVVVRLTLVDEQVEFPELKAMVWRVHKVPDASTTPQVRMFMNAKGQHWSSMNLSAHYRSCGEMERDTRNEPHVSLLWKAVGMIDPERVRNVCSHTPATVWQRWRIYVRVVSDALLLHKRHHTLNEVVDRHESTPAVLERLGDVPEILTTENKEKKTHTERGRTVLLSDSEDGFPRTQQNKMRRKQRDMLQGCQLSEKEDSVPSGGEKQNEMEK